MDLQSAPLVVGAANTAGLIALFFFLNQKCQALEAKVATQEQVIDAIRVTHNAMGVKVRAMDELLERINKNQSNLELRVTAVGEASRRDYQDERASSRHPEYRSDGYHERSGRDNLVSREPPRREDDDVMSLLARRN
jgi:uncharacterized coiled-coil protein SlyX